MFHLSATVHSHISAIRQGWPTYVLPRFDAQRFIALVERYQITDTAMVPAMMNMILQSGHVTPSSLRSLRDGTVGAAPVSPELLKKWQALLRPDCSFTGGYGMTEMAGVMAQIYWPEQDPTCNSIGRLMPGLEAKCVTIPG
jgi:acyl-CoA synthetase (AMP-forming)/AMP-acid ligase II